ncbi:transketolase [Anaerovibrio sp.]|uniref:transketolase n=1 Tax=Anaerovibrio sp. TaxID=1872532 RepID=UPI0025BF7D21|nr:transketolase [Anaerovibrio sp.]
MAIVNLDKINSLAEKMRIETIKTGYSAGRKGAHFGGALSCIELLACLYGGIMNIDVSNPAKEPRDVFLLSKGHAAVSFYVALACAGYFPMEDLLEFEADGSELPGHPVMNEARGIEISTGSLGMGIGTGIGMALGYRRKGYDNHIFVLMGDGECDEGSIWEGAMAASSFGLDSLIVIVDKNSIQSDGTTKEIMDLLDLGEKFYSFGFDVREIDGHDTEKICHTFSELLELRNGKPKVVIANTIKGKGISFMENKPEWHHSALSEKQYKEAMQELGQEVSE